MTAVSPLGPSALADEAFEALYEQYSSRVFGYCLKWLRSREEAEESFAAPARNDELAGLSEALGGLTEQQRRAILLREWQGLSYREIADELDLSQAAVETLLFRARRALAARLSGAGSFLPWLKSFAGGGAGSLAVGATVVAVTAAGTIGGGRPDRAARHIAPATQPSRTHLGTTKGRPTLRPLPRRHAFARVHVAALAPTRSHPAAPTATAAAVGSTQPPAATESTVSNSAPAAAQTVTDATKPVTDPAANTVETVVASATDATSTFESAASVAIATATDVVASATATVSATVPALPTVTVPSVPPLTP